MNITIIGCGYVGMAIARHCRWNLGYSVTATTTSLARLPELAAVAQRAVVLKGDQQETLQQLLQNQDAVLLSVAPTGSQRADADIYEKTYLNTAKNLVKALQASNVKQLIYTGSCAVYGNAHGAWVDETSLPAPSNPHGEILRDVEEILLSASNQDLKVCIFRLGAIYGPEREIAARFSDLAGTVRPGTGDYFTNWTHLDDIVAATAFVLTYELQGIYNLVSDAPLTARQLFTKLCERYHLPAVEWDASLDRTRSNDRRVSNQKLKMAGYQLIHKDVEI